ncbi:MAG: hypothetical protein RIR73_1482 [Chloroflexota bacterium]|jgi:hypothetical protein
MQYFFIDESGDAGLDGQASSSSHFVMAMAQLPERTPIEPLVELRKALNVSSTFEFKYHNTKPSQKDRFFQEVLGIPFRVRAVIFDKAMAGSSYNSLSPYELTIELIVGVTMRASELDISNEVLVIDGATPAFCRDLRIEFTKRTKLENRIRPFKNIIGADSKHEDGLQLADMIAGALRVHASNANSQHFRMILPRIVDLWQIH